MLRSSNDDSATPGVVYSATLVPSAATLCIVNIGASEAKVECLLRSFVQLREQPGFAADDAVRPSAPCRKHFTGSNPPTQPFTMQSWHLRPADPSAKWQGYAAHVALQKCVSPGDPM